MKTLAAIIVYLFWLLVQQFIVYGGTFGPFGAGLFIVIAIDQPGPLTAKECLVLFVGILVSAMWVISLVFFGLMDRIEMWCEKMCDRNLRSLGFDPPEEEE